MVTDTAARPPRSWGDVIDMNFSAVVTPVKPDCFLQIALLAGRRRIGPVSIGHPAVGGGSQPLISERIRALTPAQTGLGSK